MKNKAKMVKLSTIKLNPDNPRRISTADMEKLKKSLEGFLKMLPYRPIVYDRDRIIIGGNMRFLALQQLGYKEVPETWLRCADDFTAEERRQFIITDNGQFGTWDFDALANSWGDLPLVDWGVPLPEDWLNPPMEVLDSSGNMSGANYGDARGDKIPVNILGIGGMVARELMERVKKKLCDNGADEKVDNADQLSDIFLTWVNK